ncbi:MAG: hypothetical protein DHS20C15_34520 [Planctomycetota bacterium]|nr:MAG: hypothetical protein DHS20C15_34520 [Planctomycetota bacterium]
MHDTRIRWAALALAVALATWGVIELTALEPRGVAHGNGAAVQLDHGGAGSGDSAARAHSSDASLAERDGAAGAPGAARVEHEGDGSLAREGSAARSTDAARTPAVPLRLRVLRWPDDAVVPGARVSVQSSAGGAPHELLASRAGRVSWVPPASDHTWDLYASAEGWGEAALSVSRADLQREHVLRLTPEAAWVGRVEDPLGTPLAAEIVAWQWWPPRPTLLDDGHAEGPRLLSHQRRRTLQVFRTGVDGRFLVPRLPSEDHSELVLAVRGSTLASPLLHVNLPPIDGELPPLVMRAQAPLLVQVRDPSGSALVGVELEIDDGPGRLRSAERRASSDARGQLQLVRHAGALALRPRDGGWEWLTARADAQPLRPNEEGWLEVPAGTSRVLLELGRRRRFTGRLRDELDGRVVQGAAVRAELLEDDGSWSELDAAPSDGSGAFSLRAPWEAQAGRLRLSIDAPAYEPWELELLAGIPDARGELLLRPRSSAGVLRGRVVAGEERAVVGASVRIWSAPPEERGVVRLHEPLPESYELLGELRSDANGRFETRLASAPGHQLAVLAEQSDERGLLVRSLVGPILRDAWLDSGELRLALEREAPVMLPVVVRDWPPGRAGVLETSHFYGFDGTTLTLRDSFEGPERELEDLHFSIPLPRGAESMVELRLERWPVPEPLARSDFWVRAPLRGELAPQILRVPRRVSVEGMVRGIDPRQRERVAVALLGAPVSEWRAEWLGESDRCQRPDASGRWRFDDVPLGPTTLVLYVSGETEGVEILAQRALDLTGTVSRYELVPDAPVDDPLEGRPLR